MLIWLSYHCNQEIHQNDQEEEIIDEPNKPDKCNHESWLERIGLHAMHPELVPWAVDVADRVPVCEEHVHQGVNDMVIFTSLNMDSWDLIDYLENIAPDQEIYQESSYIPNALHDQKHKSSKPAMDPAELHDFENWKYG